MELWATTCGACTTQLYVHDTEHILIDQRRLRSSHLSSLTRQPRRGRVVHERCLWRRFLITFKQGVRHEGVLLLQYVPVGLVVTLIGVHGFPQCEPAAGILVVAFTGIALAHKTENAVLCAGQNWDTNEVIASLSCTIRIPTADYWDVSNSLSNYC